MSDERLYGSSLPWPNSESISFAIPPYLGLSPEEFGCLHRLYFSIGYQSVNSMYDSGKIEEDPKIKDDNTILARVCYTPTRRFSQKIRPAIAEHFLVGGGYWRLANPEWVRLTKPQRRASLPKDLKSFVLSRQGEFCVYCGTGEGPFAHDHLFPHSHGGSDEANNLVLACQSCNSSKGDKTLTEWFAFLMDREVRQ